MTRLWPICKIDTPILHKVTPQVLEQLFYLRCDSKVALLDVAFYQLIYNQSKIQQRMHILQFVVS